VIQKQLGRVFLFLNKQKHKQNLIYTINPIDQLLSIDLTDFGQIKRFFGRSFVAGNLPKQV
jgi:hypothetical protein